MNPWHGLAVAMLLALSIGCARAPVSTAVPDAVPEKSPSPLPAVVKPTSPPTPNNTKQQLPRKEIAVPRANPEVLKNKERGLIRGVVRWEGAEPAQPTPRLRIDRATHGIAQTAVWLVSANKSVTQPPAEPVRLSAEQGAYRPHLVLAPKGGAIELCTTEERADFQASGAATFSETIPGGDRRVFPLSSAGLIEVHSQLQPERLPAFVWVLENGPGTLTAADGRFRLPPVPAGNYELMLWHEDWHPSPAFAPRTARVRITLGADEGAEVRWTLTERR